MTGNVGMPRAAAGDLRCNGLGVRISARAAADTRAGMVKVDVRGLPPVLEQLLQPWAQAIELSGLGIGDHVMAVAAHGFSALQRRIVLTPPLEQAFVEARSATDALAVSMDEKRIVPFWRRNAARVALAKLVVLLGRAKPNAITKELGLGW